MLTTGPAPTITELSQAVAEVNDWRALGLFLFAFFILREVGIYMGKRQDRIGMEKLAGALDGLSEKVAQNAADEIKHQSLVQAHITLQSTLLERATRALEARDG